MKKIFFVHSPASCTRRKRKFTLIELLIVISIIAILAGLLLPALNSAREKGKMIQCAGNLKSFGTAYIHYANDYNDYMILPASTLSNVSEPWKTMGRTWWFQTYFLGTYLGYTPTNTASSLQIKFNCPSKRKDEFNDNGGGWYFAQQTSGTAKKSFLYKRPSETIHLVEYQVRSFYLDVAYFNESKTNGSTPAYRRHNGFINILFPDGHVKGVNKKTIIANSQAMLKMD